MYERLLQLLGSGVSPAIAATAVGCSESYVSQLMSTEEFAAKVAQLRFDNLQSNTKRDGRIDSLEDKLLDKMEETLPYVSRPAELTRMFQIINGAKRRGANINEQMPVANQVVNLMIPQLTINNFVLSSQKEIVEVDGKSLVTMPAKNLLAEIAQRQQGDKNGHLDNKSSGGVNYPAAHSPLKTATA